jgi:hypothetical protein
MSNERFEGDIVGGENLRRALEGLKDSGAMRIADQMKAIKPTRLLGPPPRVFEMPRKIGSAERMFKELERRQRVIETQVESEAELPAWFLETPSGPYRIELVGFDEPFVRFVGYGASDADVYDMHLVAPSSVSIHIVTLPPDSPEPRRPVGFIYPDDADEAIDGELDDTDASSEH